MTKVKVFLLPLLIMSTLIHTSNVMAGEEVSRSISSENITNVMIDNRSGSVNVVGWDKDKISLSGELGDEVESLTFKQKGAQAYIKVEYPNTSGWNSSGSALTIFMPKHISVDFTGVSSELALSNLHGGIEAGTVSGDIVAKDLSHNIELSSISGNISSSDLSGKISLSVVSGDIDDNNSQGRLQIKTVSGHIVSESVASEVSLNIVSGDSDLSLADVVELRVSTVSGDVDVKLALKDKGLLKASSVSGNLQFIFQKDINADFALESNVGGDLINKLSDVKAKEAKYGPSSTLNFQMGDGSSTVRVNTVSGNVIVKGD
ncbi:DUF4097 domain-containing protein [Colwellia sp. D2M02]|uniref:DUF4097 family beta strand repeat-containing protein n=1 Tax=Colwellia asteriadis TaxID=517723 RepID=A0ABN1L332_9GAMM|nr:DUF4097 family beta strand repeat-containing protein [Colwellia sp. D2M02]MBU2893599.1 DUF4097 domain-containing protein [Colwellia sp. D2M02]